MKFMHGMHKKRDPQNTGDRANENAAPVRGIEVEESKAPLQVPHLGKS